MPKAQQVRKRCFVQMTGYEPVGAAHQHRRFIREMARFQKAWNVQGEVSPPVVSADGAVASWSVTYRLRPMSGASTPSYCSRFHAGTISCAPMARRATGCAFRWASRR